MKRLFVMFALAAGAPAMSAPAADGVKGAWVRTSPAPGRPAAGYFELTNGIKADALTGAEVPGARVEMHTMAMEAGVMRMRPIQQLALKPGETVAFKSGGYHLMIFGLASPGKSLPLTLVFASGAKITVPAEVHGAADGGVQPNPHAGH